MAYCKSGRCLPSNFLSVSHLFLRIFVVKIQMLNCRNCLAAVQCTSGGCPARQNGGAPDIAVGNIRWKNISEHDYRARFLLSYLTREIRRIVIRHAFSMPAVDANGSSIDPNAHQRNALPAGTQIPKNLVCKEHCLLEKYPVKSMFSKERHAQCDLG